MTPTLYVSTSCLSVPWGMRTWVDRLKARGIRNVEIGVWREGGEEGADFFRRSGCRFILHHYYPPPRRHFVVNLASTDRVLRGKSIRQMRRSIDFCVSAGIPLFSLHAGFRADPDRHFRFSRRGLVPYEQAFRIFVDSIGLLNDYARRRRVKIAVENNGVEKKNVIGGKEHFLLLAEEWEYARLFREIESKNLGIVLDFGHLKVTGRTLGIDPERFITGVREKVFAVHLHDNDGYNDLHKALRTQGVCLALARKHFRNKRVKIVMEAKYRDMNVLLRNKRLLEKELIGA